ncbi:MAG: SPOR domain-containing protein [Cocleimonas sp.]|nr:SPOR domain-containing protein [Cocleimonas sp.]
MTIKPPAFSLKNYQKGASNLVIGLLIAAIGFLGLLYLKSRGIISVPTSLSNAATSINESINPFATGKAGYSIQISASHNLKDATKVMDTFADEGYDTFIVSSEIRGTTMYQVRIGPYGHREEAKTIKNRIKRRFPRNSYVKRSFIVYRD